MNASGALYLLPLNENARNATYMQQIELEKRQLKSYTGRRNVFGRDNILNERCNIISL
jgi:hypothetical protein